MAAFPTRKVVGFIRKFAVPIYVGFGLYSWYSFNKSNDHAYKFVYSRNDLDRKNELNQVESFLKEANKSGDHGKSH